MFRNPTASLLAILFALTFYPTARAGDWPQFRADAARSGYTADAIGDEMALLWRFDPPSVPQPAWPRSDRMPFDRAMHAVVAQSTVYFGSSSTGKVYALDAKSGKVRWTFYTGGPIRFSPAVLNDRVMVASDDGYLYALSAADGKVTWKVRGGPSDLLRLGNEKMISKWPARGGPVVVGDVVYFAAGIWPSEGIYLYALKADSGEVIWKNDQSGSIYMPQPHGGANAESGVAAQGYLVASGERLFVPTGRAVPAAFKIATGEFDYFHLQQYGKSGGAPTMAVGDFFFNSGLAFDAKTGASALKTGGGPLAATPDGLVRGGANQVVAYRWIEKEATDRKGKTFKTRALEAIGTVDKVDASAAIVAAKNRVVAGGAASVSVVDMAKETVVWSSAVDGTAYGLAVCDGRIFASTDKGAIYCFGPKGDPSEKESPLVINDPALVERDLSRDAKIDAAARQILDRSGIAEGFCVDLDCGDGRLAELLAERTKLHVVAIDSDEANVAAARRRMEAAGLYGDRVTVLHADVKSNSLPRYFANLVVSTKAVLEGIDAIDAQAVVRVQRPCGGVAMIGPADEIKKNVRAPLEGAGGWTHQYADAANRLCSDDLLVKGPLGMLWYRDVDVAMTQRHGRGPAPLVHQGRLYSEGIDELVCLDAYNGRTIWRLSLPGILLAYDGDELMGVSGTGSNYCIDDATGSVLVRRQDHCLQINGATGEVIGKYFAPKQADGKPGVWGYIAAENGTLVGSLANPEHVVTFRYRGTTGDMKEQLTESSALFAFDVASRALLWRHDAKDSIRHNAVAVANGAVYLIDRPTANFDRSRKGKASDKGHPNGVLVALDARSGKEKWRQEKNVFGTMLAVNAEAGAVLMSYQPTRFRLASEVGGQMAVFSTSDGAKFWEKKVDYSSRPMINERTIYAEGAALDLLSGDPRPFNFQRSYGCGIITGGRHSMFFRSATLGFFDLDKNKKIENYGGVRLGCWVNAIPAGGIVLVPDASAGCTCSYLNAAWFALEPLEE